MPIELPPITCAIEIFDRPLYVRPSTYYVYMYVLCKNNPKAKQINIAIRALDPPTYASRYKKVTQTQ